MPCSQADLVIYLLTAIAYIWRPNPPLGFARCLIFNANPDANHDDNPGQAVAVFSPADIERHRSIYVKVRSLFKRETYN